VLLTFLCINLYGVRAAGRTGDVIVLIKVVILLMFAVSGLFFIKPDHLLPVFILGESQSSMHQPNQSLGTVFDQEISLS